MAAASIPQTGLTRPDDLVVHLVVDPHRAVGGMLEYYGLDSVEGITPMGLQDKIGQGPPQAGWWKAKDAGKDVLE